jgi:beta-lactamase regulating signal transducer with metallopeptidase domain
MNTNGIQGFNFITIRQSICKYYYDQWYTLWLLPIERALIQLFPFSSIFLPFHYRTIL